MKGPSQTSSRYPWTPRNSPPKTHQRQNGCSSQTYQGDTSPACRVMLWHSCLDRQPSAQTDGEDAATQQLHTTRLRWVPRKGHFFAKQISPRAVGKGSDSALTGDTRLCCSWGCASLSRQPGAGIAAGCRLIKTLLQAKVNWWGPKVAGDVCWTFACRCERCRAVPWVPERAAAGGAGAVSCWAAKLQNTKYKATTAGFVTGIFVLCSWQLCSGVWDFTLWYLNPPHSHTVSPSLCSLEGAEQNAQTPRCPPAALQGWDKFWHTPSYLNVRFPSTFAILKNSKCPHDGDVSAFFPLLWQGSCLDSPEFYHSFLWTLLVGLSS